MSDPCESGGDPATRPPGDASSHAASEASARSSHDAPSHAVRGSSRRPPEHEPRQRRIGLGGWVAIGLGALLLLILAGVAWVLNSEPGARWVADRAVGLSGGKLEVREVSGTIAGPLTVGGIRWRDVSSGVDVHVTRVSLDVALRELVAKRVHVQMLDVRGVDVRLFEHPPKPKAPRRFSLTPPLDVQLDRLTLQDARVSKDGKQIFVARTGEAIGSWTTRGLAIQKLVVDSPEGNVHVNGEVSERGPRAIANGTVGERGSYVGRAAGGFRWKLGKAEYAGEFTAVSEKERLNVDVRMRAPFVARLAATLGETRALPWTFDLAVPTFDPREKLLPRSPLHSLAATLHGAGDRTVAQVRGDTTLNGQRLRIDPVRVRYQDSVLEIEALTLIDAAGRGTLTASGDVRFGAAAAARDPTAPPFFANLRVQWKDVTLPREWVGQPLATRGELKVVGSTATFTADGTLALGRPDRLADIALAIAGTPGQIEVKRLAVTERVGKLSATGSLRLKPRIGWHFTANAQRFDPGEFIVGWPGQLGFTLDTRGQLTEQGPDASLDLKNLQGTLRGRGLSGRAALTLSPQKVVAGTLHLRSGKSSLSLTGRGGKITDLDTQFDIASLEDWVPGSAGRLGGRFHLSGTWPVLAIEGRAHGRGLALGEYSVEAIDITADVRNPQSPQGSLRVTASEIVAKGFTFSSTDLTASGTEKDHTARLTATGQPLTVQVKVHGARAGDGWSGTVDSLTLAAMGLEPLSLRAPARVSASPRGFSISEMCLAGEHISACAAASRNEARELNASYRLEHLPLGLIAALAKPDLPLRIEGVIEGEGHLRRTPEGALFGRSQLTSASGRIIDAAAAAQADAADALLTYENLKLNAQLAGETANATIEAVLGKGGRLEGRIALANLRGASASVNGDARVVLADLSPAGLFVPQLADVHGRGEANAQVSGTLADLSITGSAALRECSAEVPKVGIKLHDGELTADIASDGSITLNGKVSSGDGQLTLSGNATARGALAVRVQGKDFVAASIPGARVFIAPDLDFERSPGKMTLAGTVTVPRADIDLGKLPRTGAGAQRASPDVVVVDEESAAIEKSKSVLLEARVTVVLGKDVNLVGYGLTSRVEGQLVVNELPGQPTTANGEVHVSGKYEAYGQDLTIEQGRLLYAGQKIIDPQVNLVATRTVDTVTAKLIVTGSARKPLLEVTSDPPMPQTQALSYLVTGKPLNEIGSGEGDRVQSAARSLGGAAGNLLAKGIGKRLGISEIGIGETPEAGGSAFTVGQYLSPRLYLSYGVGLFDPGQVVTLRYRINSRVSLEAVEGTLSQKAGITYRIEK